MINVWQMELYTKNFTTRIRYEAAVLAVDCECMGKTLLEGEATGMLHKYSSSRRSAVAEETIRKIYPVGASKAAKLRAKRRLFLSGCILPMANCIVGELGKLNIGLGMVGTVSSGPADIPPLIFPLAAMLVSFSSFFLFANCWWQTYSHTRHPVRYEPNYLSSRPAKASQMGAPGISRASGGFPSPIATRTRNWKRTGTCFT